MSLGNTSEELQRSNSRARRAGRGGGKGGNARSGREVARQEVVSLIGHFFLVLKAPQAGDTVPRTASHYPRRLERVAGGTHD